MAVLLSDQTHERRPCLRSCRACRRHIRRGPFPTPASPRRRPRRGRLEAAWSIRGRRRAARPRPPGGSEAPGGRRRQDRPLRRRQPRSKGLRRRGVTELTRQHNQASRDAETLRDDLEHLRDELNFGFGDRDPGTAQIAWWVETPIEKRRNTVETMFRKIAVGSDRMRLELRYGPPTPISLPLAGKTLGETGHADLRRIGLEPQKAGDGAEVPLPNPPSGQERPTTLESGRWEGVAPYLRPARQALM
jgi:hypothetical protein